MKKNKLSRYNTQSTPVKKNAVVGRKILLKSVDIRKDAAALCNTNVTPSNFDFAGLAG